MLNSKIKSFMALAGQAVVETPTTGTEAQRKLGAQLLLSELLEYIIKGLGVIPEVNGQRIEHPEKVNYHCAPDRTPDKLEMLDGLADVAYTMYWNACAFGVKLEEAFERVCDNNLGKFVNVSNSKWSAGPLERADWGCGKSITWPEEVVQVEVVKLPNGELYAVGKDARGKVRKPSSYKSVELGDLI